MTNPRIDARSRIGRKRIDKRETHKYVDDNGGLCIKCGRKQTKHRNRGKLSVKLHNRERGNRSDRERNVTYIGIDGEGQGDHKKAGDNHRYVLLAASTESGDREWYVEATNPRIGRLTTVECLDMILELPTRRSKIFSFSFNYDLTKMLEDLDNKSLFEIFRPDLPWRQRPACEAFKGPYPIEWCSTCRKQCKFEDERHSEFIYKMNH